MRFAGNPLQNRQLKQLHSTQVRRPGKGVDLLRCVGSLAVPEVGKLSSAPNLLPMTTSTQTIAFTESDFWNFIKDDPARIAEYHGGLLELYFQLFAKEKTFNCEKLLEWYAELIIEKPIANMTTGEQAQMQSFNDFVTLWLKSKKNVS